MPKLAAKTKTTGHAIERKAQQLECVRLRRTGLSYRHIGDEVGVSHEHARQLCDEALKEVAHQVTENADAMLGLELERIEGVIRSAHSIMLSSQSSEAAKLRAMEVIRRCADTKVRWLGLAVTERTEPNNQRTWAEAVGAEFAAMNRDELEREISALGYMPVEQPCARK